MLQWPHWVRWIHPENDKNSDSSFYDTDIHEMTATKLEDDETLQVLVKPGFHTQTQMIQRMTDLKKLVNDSTTNGQYYNTNKKSPVIPVDNDLGTAGTDKRSNFL